MSKKSQDDLDDQTEELEQTSNEPVPPEEAEPQECSEDHPPVKVTPKIDREYVVALLHRKLNDHTAGATTFVTDGTAVELWLEQDKASPVFDGTAKLTASGAGAVDWFEDAAQKKPFDVTKPIAADALRKTSKLKLYARGKTAGTVDLKLSVSAPLKAPFEAGPDATSTLHVAEVKMVVHDVDQAAVAGLEVNPDVPKLADYHKALHDKALPEQVKLTDAKKVKDGRIVHVQKSAHHGRAKVVVEKLAADQWPKDSDAYELVLTQDNVSGSLGVMKAEFDGKEVTLPARMKVKDLKKGAVTFWVEGRGATTKVCEARLDLGLDRKAKGMTHTAKKGGDWARFTVVEIAEVKLDYTAPVGKASAWDAGKSRFYINLKSDPDGRKVKLAAKLSQKIAGVKLHFALAPHPDNRKAANWGEDLPSNWKWHEIAHAVKHKDRADPNKVIHLDATTDADGKANLELTLSRFGGDVFTPACYIGQDPHLAKYVEGHAKLGKRKPALATSPIRVWRKFWYQPIEVSGIANPGAAGAVGKWADARAEMVLASKLTVTKATATTNKGIYARYKVRVNGGNADALVITDSNKANFFAGVTAEADKPVKVPLLICDAQWDADGNSGSEDLPWLESTVFPVNKAVDKLPLDPPAQGGNLLVSGTWVSQKRNAVSGAWEAHANGNLASGDISIDSGRTSLYQVRIALPAGVGAAAADVRVKISGFVVKGASGPYLGEYSRATKRILCVYDPDEAADFQNTIAHEVGHAFRQTAVGGAHGAPGHTHQYNKQGSHCKHRTNKCVMYESGPIAGTLGKFCPVCQPYVLLEDMNSFAS